MKVISNEFGRIIVIYNRDEVMPEGGYYLPDIIELFTERYKFVKSPIPGNENGGLDIKFETGQIKSNGREINIKEMIIYDDGLTIVTSNTDSAKDVLEDVMEWLGPKIGLREPLSGPLTGLENHVVVDFDNPITKILDPFKILKSSFEGAMTIQYKQPVECYFTSFGIGADPSDPVKAPKAQFSISRRVGAPYTENRFYCVAPLSTSDHHNLLQVLDDSFSSQ